MKIKLLIVIVVLVIIGIYYYSVKDKQNKSITYLEKKVERIVVDDTVEVNGQIEPLNRIEVVPPSSGRIEKIFVEEGNLVKTGDVLCLMSSSDRVAILDAARSVSEEEYKKWEDSYKPIKVISPISGRIILSNIVESQTVNSQTVLFAISDTLIATALVDESDIGKIKPGQKAFITLDAYPDTRIEGKVFQILDEGKNVNNVIIYKVKIKLFKIPSFLKSQMTANIRILVDRKKILGAPSDAFIYSKDGNVYVITGFNLSKEPVKREVVIGKDYNGIVEIKSPLKEGDVIYIEQKKYIKQSADNGKNPFMPSRKPPVAKNVMRKI